MGALFVRLSPVIGRSSEAISVARQTAVERLNADLAIIIVEEELNSVGTFDDTNGNGKFDLFIWVKNTGNARISDFVKMDLFISNAGSFLRVPHEDEVAATVYPRWSGVLEDGQTEWGPKDTVKITTTYDTPLSQGDYVIKAVLPNGAVDNYPFVIPVTLFVVDNADDLVYEYQDDGTYIASHTLDSLNANARGMTTDDTKIWTSDAQDNKGYEYDTLFVLGPSWDLDSANRDSEGITIDGSNLWVLDTKDDMAYKYNTGGAFISSFSLHSDNKDAFGITTDGTNIWVVDQTDDMAYKYDMSGAFVSSFALAAANQTASGITTNGANIWVVDKDGGRIYKYDMSGASVSSFALEAANANAEGLTVEGR